MLHQRNVGWSSCITYARRARLVVVAGVGFMLLVAGAAAVSANDATLYLIGDSPKTAQVVGLDATALRVRLGEDGDEAQTQSIPWSQVAYWGCRRAPQSLPQWLFQDGGTIVANVLRADQQRWRGGNDDFAFASLSSIWDDVGCPTSGLVGAILQPPYSTVARDQLEFRIRGANGEVDRLWLVGGNAVTGEFVQAGVKNDQAIAESWDFRVRSRTLSIASQRIVGISLQQSEPQAVRFWLGFRDGSLLAVSSWDKAPIRNAIRLNLACGGTAEMQQAAFYEQLCYVRPHHQGVLFLADAEPAEQRHRPYLSVQRTMRRGASVLGGLARVRERVYGKALGVSSESYLVYDLERLKEQAGVDRPWRRLVTSVALDDRAGPSGSVNYQVFLRKADGWATASSSGLVRSGDAPKPLQVDVEGARQIALVVGYGERGDTQDYANWLDPHLER